MGLFGFGKKKEKVAAIPQPAGKPVSVDDIPPPEGKPEGATTQPNSSSQIKPQQPAGIPEPRHVDDLEIPAPVTMPSKLDTMELPTLEFPTMPKAKPTEPPVVKKSAPPLPEVDKEEETPKTIPDLNVEKAPEKKMERPSVPKEVPKIKEIDIVKEEEKLKTEDTKPKEAKPTTLKKKVKTILEGKVEPEIKYEEVPNPTVMKEASGPLFIDMPNFKKLLHMVDESQLNIKNAVQKFQNLNNIKNKEDTNIDALQSALENAQRKLVFMDKMIFEKQEG